MRRVLMTADAVGGVWNYALELCEGLGQRSVGVTLATMGPAPSAEQRAAAARVPNIELVEGRYRLEWMDDPWADLEAAGDWLLGLEEAVAPDLVHLNGYALAALPWTRPVLVAGHSCVLSWWKAVHRGAAPEGWSRYRDAVARGLRAADLVVCPSRAMLEALAEHYPGAAPNARVIPNGRDPARFRPGPKSEFVLAAGRLWDEAKNVQALEKIALRLNWPVLVAGPDERPLPDGRGAVYLGQITPEELAFYYARAGIYALPARYEPFGLTVLEAAFAGCALVLGDIPSLREHWDEAAVFVDPGDPQALGCELERLIGDLTLRVRLAYDARRRAFQFTAGRMVEAYLETYSELVAAPCA